MIALLFAATLPVAPDFSCASEATTENMLCWKRMVLFYKGQHTSALELLTLERKKSNELETYNTMLMKNFEEMSKLAEKFGQQAIARGDVPWHASPFLWSGVTAIVVAAIAIGVAQSMKFTLTTSN